MKHGERVQWVQVRAMARAGAVTEAMHPLAAVLIRTTLVPVMLCKLYCLGRSG